jgi:sigma-B regulation protein RsbU (phosphoserine phosphatase)
MIWLEVQGSPRLPCIQAYVSLSREGPEECGLLIFLIPLGGLHDAVIDGQRLHKELSLAAQLQETLEPPRAEWDPSLEVAMYSRSFRPVGGDLHESWLSSAKESLYYVADISGKSLPAALFLPGVRHRVHKWLSQGTATDLELLSSDLHDWLPDSMFVALTLVRRKVDRDIVMINAGGPEPWLYQKRIDQAGPMADCLGVALGIQPATEYREVFARLCPGDIVTLWTDGVTEAMERAGLAPGHFLQELGRSLPGTLQQGLDDMVGRLRTSDDATVMALRETA